MLLPGMFYSISTFKFVLKLDGNILNSILYSNANLYVIRDIEMTVVLLGKEQVATYALMVYHMCITRDNFFSGKIY